MTRQVVVTGAASGIGAATAAMLTAQGDHVISVDLRDADVVADLATRQGREQAVADVLEQTGGVVDAVVACAGTSSLSPLDVKVNYFGVVDFLEGLRPALARAEAPRVSMTSSISSTQPTDQEVVDACLDGDEERAVALAEKLHADGRGSLLYASSKNALTRWLRRTAVTEDWAGAGIPLNAVGPGVVVTPMTEGLRASEQGVEMMKKAVPSKLGGWMGPEVIADALVWLIRPANTHTTAQILFMDGGAEAVVRGPEAF
ncbi:SDR family oxidoreductase [Nocardioides sp. Soil796]|uniref:SDR family oxidoreductase n=1 Tax=Nocardioides sp. Soil796 TaxID=1736412 RepID=UPI000709FC12|nr:SDR family oxidoreductase [Nocardioides sp. Soil796]KRF10447.1 short-chain dehydrogenase [Nocardioides sp. Soil796]